MKRLAKGIIIFLIISRLVPFGVELYKALALSSYNTTMEMIELSNKTPDKVGIKGYYEPGMFSNIH